MSNELVRTQPCGWCGTNDHENCIGYVKHYDTIWICGCSQAGCGTTSVRNTSRASYRGTVPGQETVSDNTVPPIKEDDGETVLLEDDIKDERASAGRATVKSSRARKTGAK